MPSHKEKYEARRAAGLCYRCGQPAGGKSRCRPCLDRIWALEATCRVQRKQPPRPGAHGKRTYLHRRVVDDDSKRQMAEMFTARCTTKEIGIATGFHPMTVGRTLAAAGFDVMARLQEQQVPQDDVALAAELYQKGRTLGEIATATGWSRTTIHRHLRESGIEMLTRSEASRTYSLNEEAFDVDSPARDYWLGFIFADGCVIQLPKYHRWSLAVGLAEKDRAHLEKLRAFLGSNKPIYNASPRQGCGAFPGSTGGARFSAESQRLCLSLMALGIMPRKSLTAEVPERFAMNADWMRGLVDGDGWVTCNRSGVPILGVTGTRQTCEAFLNFLRQFGRTTATVGANHSIWKSQVSGAIAVAALQVMYAGAEVALDRKHQKAMSLLGWRDKSGRRPRCRPTLL